MSVVYLSLGSNCGNRRKYLITALALLAERAGDVVAISSFHETEPWGFESPNKFLNVAAELHTALNPCDLLHLTQQIEIELGRTKKTVSQSYGDRCIDIDILLYDSRIIQTPDLTIPHPLMHERLFVLQPLAEIAPHMLHPILQLSVNEMIEQLSD
ncbi:MAG: 2-amino-4-hydroxy-6-hydroxymethyldihydropteridine diphosphokinase [Tannerella sp.]|jgi:2-amino-4-hydroxy-6-hydroxymethyldihydropteridine diphosphokinase|nr:2-amino-4-hydroxy-6-hydroxymethyldihydropteridine diphosphokinase [Tannerella sp.]